MDFATTFSAGPDGIGFDWSMNGPDLASDDSLKSYVLVSLFTDRLCNDDDAIPDGSKDRRGWWADLPIGGAVDESQQDRIGSRMWLLERAKATDATAAAAKHYCTEALQWLLSDGIAQSVTVETQWLNDNELGITVSITRANANTTKPDPRFDLVWAKTVTG